MQSEEDIQTIIKALITTQSFLHNEMSLQDFEKELNKKIEDTNKKNVLNLFGELKQYWTYQFLNSSNEKKSLNTNFLKKFFQAQFTHENELKLSFSFEEFCNFCENNIPDKISQESLNYITLSLVPTYFDFFVSSKKCDDYLKLIPKINDKYRQNFEDTLFLIPDFLNFISTAFRPIFLPYFNSNVIFKNSIGIEKEILKQMIISWKDNLSLCPKIIMDYVAILNHQGKNGDMKFIGRLFEKMLKKPNIYQINYYHLNDFFESNSIDSFISSFMTIYDQPDDLEGSFSYRFADLLLKSKKVLEDALKKTLSSSCWTMDITDIGPDGQKSEEIHIPLTLDSIDKSFFALHVKNNKLEKIDNLSDIFNFPESSYEIFVSKSPIIEISGTLEPLHSTPISESFANQSSTSELFVKLRELLKVADLIPNMPNISKYKTYDDLLCFIEDYLLKRGKLSTYAKRGLLFKEIKEQFMQPSNVKWETDIWEKGFEKMSIMHHKEFDIFKKINDSGEFFLKLSHRLKPVKSSIIDCFQYTLLKLKINEFEIKSSPAEGEGFFFWNPAIILSENITRNKKIKFDFFNKVSDKYTLPSEYNRYLYHIAFEKSALNFYEFLNKRKDLILLDCSFQNRIQTKRNEIKMELSKKKREKNNQDKENNKNETSETNENKKTNKRKKQGKKGKIKGENKVEVEKRSIEKFSYLREKSDIIKKLNIFVDEDDDYNPEITESSKNISEFNKKVNSVAKDLSNAFLSFTDPYQKMEDIYTHFQKCQNLLAKEASLENLGSNEINPLRELVFLIANPPNFVSSLVYIYEYVSTTSLFPENDGTFQSIELFVQNILELLMPEITFQKLLYSNREVNHSAVICGNPNLGMLKTNILARAISGNQTTINERRKDFVKNMMFFTLYFFRQKAKTQYFFNIMNINGIDDFTNKNTKDQIKDWKNNHKNNIDFVIATFDKDINNQKQINEIKAYFNNFDKNIKRYVIVNKGTDSRVKKFLGDYKIIDVGDEENLNKDFLTTIFEDSNK